MEGLHKHSLLSWFGIWTLLVSLLSLSSQVAADDTVWIPFTTDEGTIYLDDDRRPALYTGDFGDCQGNSLINVSRFDASLYRDNMTVMFHMEGTTSLDNEKIMMYLSVYAYGENRFDLIINPCTINTPTLCPIRASVPVSANGLLPIGASDLAGVPSIAFQIPDFEGQAILRIFSNTTQSQIACYSAVMSNGASFSHPEAVGSLLGVFAAIALVSSVAVAVYGQVVPETRKHYAHSISVFVVFSVFQHIFFTGALSVNWPSVLVAFWSNYGWSAGMIYSRSMQNSINRFIGSNFGNISTVGSAPSNQNFADLGGGYDLSQLYKRNILPSFPVVDYAERLQRKNIEHTIYRRAADNATGGYTWGGEPVAPGLPLPGNYSSFAGTLGELKIPASNAFLTGLIWLLILIAIVGASVIALKWIIEGLAAIRVVKTDRLGFFRSHWLQFTAAAVLRICFIAFFMMVFLTLFQFTLGGATGAIALAAVVLVIFLVGMFGAAAYALWYRLRSEKFTKEPGRLQLVSKKHGVTVTHDRVSSEKQPTGKIIKSFSVPSMHFVDPEARPHVHDDVAYTTRFGWMASRFRRSKWWFFSVWLLYEFVRACFYGGAAGHPLTQVFGLLAWEIIAFIAIIIMRPFESSRLNLLMVYFLGFSKVATVALSSAFDPRFNLGRILCTVIGVVIIVIQGVLTICLMIAIVVGAISSYMSVTRYNEEFRPKRLAGVRTRFFAHVDLKDTDKPAPPPPPPPPEPEFPKSPYFAVTQVRRERKIEDEGTEDGDLVDFHASRMSMEPESYSKRPMSQSHSVKSRTSTSNLPYGARQHRASWSTRDFQDLESQHSLSAMPSRLSMDAKQSRMSLDNLPESRGVRQTRSASLVDAANPDSRPLTPRTSDLQLKGSKRHRSNTTPHKMKRRSEVLTEDAENEIQPVSAGATN